MDMNPAWLTYPLALTGSRAFECGDFTEEECSFYMQRWHFWFVQPIYDLSVHELTTYLGISQIWCLRCQQWRSSCVVLASSSSATSSPRSSLIAASVEDREYGRSSLRVPDTFRIVDFMSSR